MKNQENGDIINMVTELWRPVVGYENRYEVSNLGRIKSLPKYNRETTIFLHPTINKRTGRVSVMLAKAPGIYKRVSLHRIVAMAFVDNPEGHNEINHIDENPQNNRADNLEWCTRKYNMNYGTTPIRLNEKRKIPVVAENAKGDIITFNSVRAADRMGFSSRGIYYSMNDNKEYKGYKWRYKDEQQGKRKEGRA